MDIDRFEQIVTELRSSITFTGVTGTPKVTLPKPIVTATAQVTTSAANPVYENFVKEEIIKLAESKGYSPVVIFEWNWAGGGVTFDTSSKGPIGSKGIFIATFVATGPEDEENLAYVDAIGYPAPNQGNILKMSLSTSPCDFSTVDPAFSESYAPTITYGVGKVPKRWYDRHPTAVSLKPGVRYFINVSGKDSYESDKHGGPEIRVAMRIPSGH